MKLTSNITRKSKQSKKTKIKILDNKGLRLVSMSVLNAEQIKKLTKIYNDYGSSTDRTEEQIKQFVIDEKNQIKKPDIHRQYYGYCIFSNNVLVGYIIGKKNTHLLEQKYLLNSKPNKFDVLFVIHLDENYKNKGIP